MGAAHQGPQDRLRPGSRRAWVQSGHAILAAKPWTYWIAFPLVLMALATLVAVVVGYLVKVVAAKYPRQ